MERPERVLIDIVNACPNDLMTRISPDTMKIKDYIKVPMVLLILCSSMMSTISMIMIKMLGELVQSATWTDFWLINIIMVILMGVSGAFQLHSLNSAMRLYDQLEVVPVYQTALMLSWILGGLFILEEKKYYSWA